MRQVLQVFHLSDGQSFASKRLIFFFIVCMIIIQIIKSQTDESLYWKHFFSDGDNDTIGQMLLFSKSLIMIHNICITVNVKLLTLPSKEFTRLSSPVPVNSFVSVLLLLLFYQC